MVKFDVVIGNPPYQEGDGGKRDDGTVSSSASPLYPDFVKSAITISDTQSLIVPARWVSGAGKGVKGFSKEMLESKTFKSFDYYIDSKNVFPNNDIMGGICHFVKDKTYHGPANITVVSESGVQNSRRLLDENNINVFIPFKELSQILKKVDCHSTLITDNISNMVSARKPYGLSTDFFDNPSKYSLPKLRQTKTNFDDIEVFGLEKGRRTSRFVHQKYPLPKGKDLVPFYKVLIPYAHGGGTLGTGKKVSLLGKPLVAPCNSASTETFLNVGSFENEIEAVNLSKYLKTKFLQTLVGVYKTTQHGTKKVYQSVPLQDFTEESDIDWSKSIAEIDQQLYVKYGLSEEEITFIETHVKEMD